MRLKSVNWWGECSEKSRASPARLCHLLGSVSVSCCCVRTRHADSVMGWDGLSAGRWGGLSWADSRVNGVSSGPLTADTGLPHLARRAGQGLFSHGPAARGPRGTGRPLEGASFRFKCFSLIHWLRQLTWPRPRSRGGKPIAPTVGLRQGCGAGRDRALSPSLRPSQPAIWVSLSEVTAVRGWVQGPTEKTGSRRLKQCVWAWRRMEGKGSGSLGLGPGQSREPSRGGVAARTDSLPGQEGWGLPLRGSSGV